MMLSKKTTWLDEQSKIGRSGEQTDRNDLVYFGYQKVPREEKVHRTCLHFETVAKRYDFMNTLLSFGIHYLWKRSAIRMMKLKPGDRVLDVCGGTGDLSILAHRSVGTAGRVVLFDINRAMIQAGKTKPTHASVRRQIQHVQGNAEALSFPDNYFDAAMVGFGIRNVTRMEQGFTEMHRILKPGGTLMCLEFSKPTAPLFRFLYDFYSFKIMPLLGELLAGSRRAYTLLPESIRTFPLPGELADILKRIGFRRVVFRRLTNGIAVVHLGKKQ
ncbi:MAG: bifunctional demethylmenaquinone methyltransferase/2-methoxy-6-polyprenyl-1,4-benzoquinol methylase UbiE [Desulfobacterales bacterium]|nr:bifunctional demethylmenaquinone methyltransferase/2-methoxy-6-polyprenyl-1,4-benzoquinol methylase UbiE [Desulfobacterales bacterium]